MGLHAIRPQIHLWLVPMKKMSDNFELSYTLFLGPGGECSSCGLVRVIPENTMVLHSFQ